MRKELAEEREIADDLTETTVDNAEPKRTEEDFDRALDAALEASIQSDAKGDEAFPRTESSAAAKSTPAAVEASAKSDDGEVEPPAEFSAEGKDAWRRGDRKGIHAEYRRIHEARTRELSRLQTETHTLRQMSQTIAPYLEAAGLKGKDPTRAIMESVAVVNEIRKNPREALAKIAEARGIKVQFGDDGSGQNAPASPEISDLRNQVQALTSKLQADEVRRLAMQFDEVFGSMRSATNGAGEPMFPDLTPDDRGRALAMRIGSLVRSRDFVAAVRSRIPGASLRDLVVEAYRWHGGRVSESAGTRSLTDNEQIERARRAASSQPGRGLPGAKPSKRKFATLEQALDAALDELSD